MNIGTRLAQRQPTCPMDREFLAHGIEQTEIGRLVSGRNLRNALRTKLQVLIGFECVWWMLL